MVCARSDVAPKGGWTLVRGGIPISPKSPAELESEADGGQPVILTAIPAHTQYQFDCNPKLGILAGQLT
jgi:hypothetical protein